MWDKRVVEVTEECIRDYSVSLRFKNVANGWEWAFVGTYGPNVDKERRRLWEELVGVYSFWDVPWCMEEDFNITRFPCERSGHLRNSTAMEEFSKFIFELDLMDLPLVGGKYTWSNGRIVGAFIVVAVISSLKTCGLPRTGKLKALKQDLKKWNVGVFGHIDNQKTTLMEELQELEGRELSENPSEEMIVRKGTVLASLERVLLLKETSWRQKSKALLLKEGDKCTKYFHKMANSHQRNKAIESLHSGNQVLSSPSDLENHIVDYYETLLTELTEWRPKLDALSFDAIDFQNASVLERPFDDDEIYKVIVGMTKDKA
ncbi:uncharacterized protein LOC122278723 [Carya illinoinensis]|uniref:uncharacterized protein LOC122278723 n=1 Tax=Carya illinoinensis TaxID=32201 RepID=UPI001C71A9F6|nr:uncharacterized protein LOC122278723 [Carya illinoinensis]